MRAAATIMVLTPRSQSLVVAVRWASPGGRRGVHNADRAEGRRTCANSWLTGIGNATAGSRGGAREAQEGTSGSAATTTRC